MRVYRYTLALPTDDSGVTSLELPKEAKILTAAINDGEVVLIALVSTNAVAAQLAVTAAANLAAEDRPRCRARFGGQPRRRGKCLGRQRPHQALRALGPGLWLHWPLFLHGRKSRK